MQLVSPVLEWKAGDPFLVPQAGSQTRVITRSELVVALELCFHVHKYMEKAESRREVEELAGGGEVKSLS